MAEGAANAANVGEDVQMHVEAINVLRRMPTSYARAGHLDRLCVWGAGLNSTHMMWEEIKRMVGAEQHHIVKVDRVFQRDGHIRFDIYVDNSMATIQHLLKKKGRALGWFSRPHDTERYVGPRNKVVRPVVHHKKLTIATLNLQGVKEKREEIALLSEEKDIDVWCFQETLRPAGQWPLRIPGYQTVVSYSDDSVAGARGIAIAVKRELCGYAISDPSPYYLFVRIVGESFPNSLIVGCVYCPCDARLKKTVKKQALEAVKGYRARFPLARIVLAGDFNQKTAKLTRNLLKTHSDLRIVQTIGSSKTFHRRNKPISDIDHVLAYPMDGFSRAEVCRTFDISDHYPLLAYLDLQVPVTPSRVAKRSRTRFVVPSKTEEIKAIVCNNKFEALKQLLGEEEVQQDTVDNMAQTFVDTCHQVATDVNALKKSGCAPPKKEVCYLSNTVKAGIREKRAKFDRVKEASNPVELELAWLEYLKVRDRVKKSIAKERKERWIKAIHVGINYAIDGEFRKFWRWLKAFWAPKSARGVTPIQDPDTGELLVSVEEIAQKWAQHYGSLAADPTTHSKDREYWTNKLVDLPQLSQLEQCDDELSWSEVNMALKGSANGKSPGMDEIPVEWLKLCITSNEAQAPDHVMGQVLFTLCKVIFNSGFIPKCWQSALVVSLPKKGDPSIMDNYRGISLIATTLKIITTVIARRLSSQLDKERRLHREQAGFRTLEECVAQAAALLEVTQRRYHAGKPTWLVFFDLKKAFDTVPHMALMTKLGKIGVWGKTLAFIEALYEHSNIAICGGDTMHYAELLRGVRQGCPLSPLLFDIFINDVLDEAESWSVEVPDLVERLAGLLFADDMVAVGENPETVQVACDAVGRWADRNEMQFGIKKCGVMLIQPANMNLEKPVFIIGGEAIPNVSEYIYLGIKITEDVVLNLKPMVQYRVDKFLSAWHAMRHLLSCRAIPITYRKQVLNTVLLPTLLYGSELWGMNGKLAHIAQKAANKAIRDIAGSKAIQINTICAELGIEMIHACSISRRARLFQKALTGKMRTWLPLLACNPSRVRKATWTSACNKYLKQHYREVLNEKLSPQSSSKKVLSKSRQKLVSTKKVTSTKSWSLYMEKDYENNKSWVKLVADKWPEHASGLTALMKLRTSSFYTCQRLAQARLIPSQYKSQCPSCGTMVPDTAEHFVLECRHYAGMRDLHIGELMQAAALALGNDMNPQRQLSLLLGGSFNGRRLDGWIPDTQTRIPEPHEALATDTPRDNLGCIRVARFLQYALAKRAHVIGGLLDPNRNTAPEDLGPEG